MSLLSFLFNKEPKSASTAKERLQIIIARERTIHNGPDFMPALHQELIAVISKYVRVNPEDIKISLDKTDPYITDTREQLRTAIAAARVPSSSVTPCLNASGNSNASWMTTSTVTNTMVAGNQLPVAIPSAASRSQVAAPLPATLAKKSTLSAADWIRACRLSRW